MPRVTTLDESFNHSQNGMSRSDMTAAALVATRLNEVIIFRSTGPWSKRWLERNYPSKNFHVKGKSSDWGPHAGLVPTDGVYSKVGFNGDKAAAGSSENQKGLKSRFAVSVQLRLDETLIGEQLNRAEGGRTAIQAVHPMANGDKILMAQRSGDQKIFAFRARRALDGKYDIWVYDPRAGLVVRNLIFENPSTPLYVMASNEIGADQLPMTGDYDLMAVCPTWASYGNSSSRDIHKPAIRLHGVDAKSDHLPVEQRFYAGWGMDRVLDPRLHTMGTARSNWVAMQEKSEKKVDLKDLAKKNQLAEHPDMGNLTPRILQCINALNAEMKATDAKSALRRVHHNAESHRHAIFNGLNATDMTNIKPGEEFADGFPLTSFQPEWLRTKLGMAGNVVTIETLADFRLYAAELYRAGFYVPRSWTWGMDRIG